MDPKAVVAYVEPLSVTAGDTLRVMVSCSQAKYHADLVKLICGDDRPRGTGFAEATVVADFAGTYDGREQPLNCGSYAELRDLPAFLALTFRCDVFPTTPALPNQSIVSGPGFDLSINDAHLMLTARDNTLRLNLPMKASRWHEIHVASDGATTRLKCIAHGLGVSEPAQAHVEAHGHFGVSTEAGNWYLAALQGRPGFNGRIEAPAFGTGEAAVIWDFSVDMAASTLRASTGHVAEFMQHPARAVKGRRWDGSTQRWGDDPAQYAAVHFHDDDLTDAKWQADIEWRIPTDLPSGVYAVRLTPQDGDADDAGASEDHAVFFVRPAPGARRADVVYLASTASYMAYANQHDSLFRNRNRSEAWYLTHPEVGKSLYEYHSDGSGVMYSSRKRPILNLKPRTLTWSFNADTNVTAWLENEDLPFDVVTDEDLHREGAAILSGYRVVVTGTHPEYYSTRMSDSLQAFLSAGGRLMYMGGNGFYWRIAFDPSDPAVIEVRRAEGGTRMWMAEPGEYYHAFTGEYGGLWRRLGRPPNQLVGIGFAAQGFDGGTYYRLQPDADDPRAAFVMAGINQEQVLGDYGTQGGGAAGEEIDRWDPSLGSPAHALVLASSEDHRPGMMRTIEEFHATESPRSDHPKVRADIVFFETPSGGAVFSTGSISFAGALSHDGYDNDVARMCRNVLTRFASAEAFDYPG